MEDRAGADRGGGAGKRLAPQGRRWGPSGFRAESATAASKAVSSTCFLNERSIAALAFPRKRHFVRRVNVDQTLLWFMIQKPINFR